MSDYDNGVINEQESMQKEIDELKAKYSSVAGRMESLESSRQRLEENISNINNSFEQVNRNIQNIMDRLNQMNEPKHNSMNAIEDDIKTIFSLGRSIGSPIRRLAISTVGLGIALTERTAESVSGFRKNIEDIVVEAREMNNQRRMHPEGQS